MSIFINTSFYLYPFFFFSFREQRKRTCTPANLRRVESSRASEPEVAKIIVNENDSEVNDLFLWSKFKRRKRKEYGSCGVLQLTSFVYGSPRFARDDIFLFVSLRENS